MGEILLGQTLHGSCSAETHQAVNMRSITPEDVERVFKEADEDGKGKISIDKFLYAMCALESTWPSDSEEERRAFSESKFWQDKVLIFTDFEGDKLVSLEAAQTFVDLMNTEDYEEMMAKLIKLCDVDKDGFLTAKELKLAIMKVMVARKERGVINNVEVKAEKKAEIFIKMGSDHADKKLKVEEAVKLIFGKALYDDPKEFARTMFRMIDTNQDRFVTKRELADYISVFDWGPLARIVDATVAEADKDEDGKMNYEEFCNWMDTNKTLSSVLDKSVQ